MKKLHPACGCPTQFTAKVIAICDLIFGMIGIFWFVYILEGYGLLMKDPEASTTFPDDLPPLAIFAPTTTTASTPLQNSTKILHSSNTVPEHSEPFLSVSKHGIQINGMNGNVFLSAFYTSVNIIAFVLLLSAAHDKNVCKLQTWWVIRLLIFVLKCVLYLTYAILGAELYEQIPHIFFMIIHLYGLWVVAVFIKEIKEERSTGIDDSSVPYTVEVMKKA